DGAHRGWGAPCNRRGALLRGSVKQKSGSRSTQRMSNQNPASEGVDNRSGVLCSLRGKEEACPPSDTRLAEQGRNRDHHSSDPCTQAKKEKKITQEHRHVTPPSLPCAGPS